MRVGMYYNNNDVRVEEMPVPKIGPGELLVKVLASGICGTDVLEWYRIKKAPIVLGHEIAGEIVAAGDGVREFTTGDRVHVSHHIPCNTCRYCLRGHHTACETLHTTNFDPGGFAEYLRVPALNADRGTFVLPPEMSFDEGTFIEPLGCIVRGQRVAGLSAGQSVLILGSGISGLLHLMLARASGAGRILTTDINEHRLALARDLGADAAIRAVDDVPAQVRDLNGGRPVDLAIVCTGALPAFQQALESVDRGGTVLFFASTNPGVELPVQVDKLWRNSIRLMPSYGSAPLDSTVAIELIRSGRVPVMKLVTDRFGLDKIAQGFRLVAQSDNSLKVIIEPHRS
ncbi:MAG: alcohol dehydrogenase catalytic domain-containing protein [Chitinivibrionales bacterium]|nr:alcohol dehydrogenase catalytic domain-containing protein [Chitinivibrionales bacterium]MBD3397173.1 alcohol dehydrogenase catalytic domain-containing protein [Chitinivibrionales bacterium]